MENRFYPAVKKLVSMHEWKTYEYMLKDAKDKLLKIVECDDEADLKELQIRIKEINRILRMPHQLIEEFEEIDKEIKEEAKTI